MSAVRTHRQRREGSALRSLFPTGDQDSMFLTLELSGIVEGPFSLWLTDNPEGIVNNDE
jgi:hypothetical protein